MFGSETLEVAIGLVLVYFIMSLLCSTVTELITRWLSLRARTLKDGILKLINGDQNLYQVISENPLFKGLSPKDPKNPRDPNNPKDPEKEHWWDLIKIVKWHIFKKNHYGPSELPPATFAQIIIDTVMDAGKKPGSGYTAVASSVNDIRKTDEEKGESKSLLTESFKVVETLENNLVLTDTGSGILDKTPNYTDIVPIISNENKLVLKSLLAAAKTKVNTWDGAITEFRASLEKWFDDSQQRVTGWYKRKTQLIVLCLAVVICFGLNVDSIGIAKSLFSDPALRDTVVAAAEAQVEQSVAENVSANATYTELRAQLDSLNLPIGWTTETGDRNRRPDDFPGWLVKIIGIFITAFAVTLGAPFWFDLLSKLVNLRAAGKKPEKT